jgi:hypothetical protein
MKKATSIEMASVLGLYVKRWQRWVIGATSRKTWAILARGITEILL